MTKKGKNIHTHRVTDRLVNAFVGAAAQEGRDRAGNNDRRHNRKNCLHNVNFGQTCPKAWERRPVGSWAAYYPHNLAVMVIGNDGVHDHPHEWVHGLRGRDGFPRDTSAS